MMKRFMVLMLGLCVLLCAAPVASAGLLEDVQAKGTLVVGAEVSFPPYEFYYPNPETGEDELAGFEMALAKGLSEELGVEMVLADQAFSGLITALRAGELDVIISGLSIKPDRLEVVDFTDPYYGGTQIVLVRKEGLETYKTPEDFAGLNIGAQTGSLQQGIADEQFATAQTMLLDKVPLLVMELRLGTIEGIILTDNVAKIYTTLYPDDLAISEVPVFYESPGVGIAVAKGDNASFLELANAYIASVKEDGTFDAWLDEAIALNANLVKDQAE